MPVATALLRLLLIALFALLSPAAVLAAASTWDQGAVAEVRLISATDGVGTAAQHSIGIEFQMQPKWKIYWRSPGDAGAPPMPDWSASVNVKDAQIHWPVPERFSFFGVDTFGYQDHVILPVSVTPEVPGEPVVLDTRIDYLICDDVCIPAEANLTLELGPGDATPSPEAGAIGRFLAAVPGLGAEQGLTLSNLILDSSGENPVVRVTATSDLPFIAPDLLPEAPAGYIFSRPELTFSSDGKTVILTSAAGTAFPPDEQLNLANLSLTVTDSNRGIEASAAELTANAGASSAGLPDAAGPGLLIILLFALAGGLILNLMPCVLPVLSLKLLSVLDKSGRDTGEIRSGFLASAAGIIVSFLAIAAALLALRGAGVAIGWGIQFQQPLFLVLLIAVILIFAANMLGWFEFRTPQFAARATDGGSGYGRDFLTGMFATLLATPCSAPFLGTAIGFALIQPSATLLLIFTALGTGMALPYLLVALFPATARLLPRPGRWMAGLKVVLALMLVATALWLLTVLYAQTGLTAALLTAAAAAALTGGIWLTTRNRTAGLGLTATAVIAIALPSLFLVAPPARVQADGWTAFSDDALQLAIADGETVFVDVTADWCITCKVNKSAVLAQSDVKSLLEGGGVTALRADWTRPDAGIQRYLGSFGRAGIPFNVVYGPSAPHGITLPELLTRDAVLTALDQAR